MEEVWDIIDPVMLILVGAFVSPLLALLKGTSLSIPVQHLVAFGISVVVGLLVAAAQGIFTAEGIPVCIAAVYITQVATYYGIWKPSGTADKIESRLP